MRLDSIRHRLLAIIVIFLISMTLLVILQIYSVNRLVGIQSHADLLSDLNIELLQLRRHEKDFLLRREISMQALNEATRRLAEYENAGHR